MKPLGVQCHDCKAPATVQYTWVGRCASCANKFDEQNRLERLARISEVHVCAECNEVYTGEYACPHCCDHEPDPDEGFHCMSCGEDRSEHELSRLADQYDPYAD